MSIFQCQKCGCSENTALTRCYHCIGMLDADLQDLTCKSNHEAILSYKIILGLKPDQPFGRYCSACCPIWFNEKGSYGVGPNPNPSPDKYNGGGIWHGRWERRFYPKDMMETNRDGNLCHKVTKETDLEKYRLPAEEGTYCICEDPIVGLHSKDSNRSICSICSKEYLK